MKFNAFQEFKFCSNLLKLFNLQKYNICEMFQLVYIIENSDWKIFPVLITGNGFDLFLDGKGSERTIVQIGSIPGNKELKQKVTSSHFSDIC